jgi:quercetin dioxygenase-like cupin family protein
MALGSALAPLLGSLAFFLALAPAVGAETEYQKSTQGTRYLERAGLSIKILVEASNFGGSEVEVGEITFPAQSPGGNHIHGTNEIFYVLSGRMDHIVNGESNALEPGMVGIVRKGDTVSHKVLSDEPVKALVIWAPGGEVERIGQAFQERAID